MSTAENHWRHECKYRLDACQKSILQMKASCIMAPDPHAEGGHYCIRSVYFDDLHDGCLRENLDGTDPRAKFRIRYYQHNLDYLVLEKKSKNRGLGKKEACGITRQECEALLQGNVPALTPQMPPQKQKLFAQMQVLGLVPKVIVTYDRTPFVYSGGNVRVTFDENITSSEDVQRFLSADYRQRPILPCGTSILEVKWDELLPRHIQDTLRLERLNLIAFSKYHLCRTFHL